MKKLILKYPLIFLLLLTVVLRLPHLSGSFWLDEAAQALEIVRPFSQQLDIIADFQPPLLHFILHFAQYFSHSEWFLRIIGAVIPGIITVLFTYKIAEQLFSKRVAFFSGLLLATSSFHIFYSQELRPYSLPTALALASMFYFLQVLQTKHSRLFWKKSISDSVIFLTICNILGLYASYLYPFFMFAQIGYAVFIPKLEYRKQLLLSFVISILAFLPFLPIFLQQLAAGGEVRASLPGWEQIVSVTQLKALPLVFGKLLFGVLPLELSPVLIGLGILLGTTGLLILPQLFKNLKKLDLKFLLVWIFVPLLTAWLVSFVVPVIQPKRLLFLLPALYLLLAHIIDVLTPKQFLVSKINTLTKKHSAMIHQAALLFLGALLILNIVSTISYYILPKLQRENWRGLLAQMHQEFVPEETLLVYSFPEPFAPMRWYELEYELNHEKKQFKNQELKTTTTFPHFTTKTLYIENLTNLSNDLKIAASYKTILVFDYLRDLTDPNKRIESVLLELGFKEVGVLDYPNIGFVRIFMQPYELISENHLQ